MRLVAQVETTAILRPRAQAVLPRAVTLEEDGFLPSSHPGTSFRIETDAALEPFRTGLEGVAAVLTATPVFQQAVLLTLFPAFTLQRGGTEDEVDGGGTPLALLRTMTLQDTVGTATPSEETTKTTTTLDEDVMLLLVALQQTLRAQRFAIGLRATTLSRLFTPHPTLLIPLPTTRR